MVKEKIKYGLIVVDPEQEGDKLDILHFVGYWNKPTEKDIEALKNELATDKQFGLTEIIYKLNIVFAPDSIVEYYNNLLGFPKII
jgi:hypothetical protein